MEYILYKYGNNSSSGKNFEFSQRFWKGIDEAQKRACDVEDELRREKVVKQG